MLPKQLLKEIKKIEIKTKQLVEAGYAGNYKSVFKGRGVEFAGIREYYRGDEYRSIDWKVTARSGKLHVKEHIEERELQVIIALDLSRSMAFGSGTKEKRETAVEFASAIIYSASSNNDRTGICLFTDKIEKYIPPAKGTVHNLRLIRELLYYLPQSYKTDISNALNFLINTITRRSVIFFITDSNTLEHAQKELKVISNKHDFILVIVIDQRETELPNIGLIELEDPETGEEVLFDTSNRKIVDQLLHQQMLNKLKILDLCKKIGIDKIELQAGKPIIEPLSKLFSEREKRRSCYISNINE